MTGKLTTAGAALERARDDLADIANQAGTIGVDQEKLAEMAESAAARIEEARSGFIEETAFRVGVEAAIASASLAPAGDGEPSDATVDYVSRYGGRCRECADHPGGMCPNKDYLPCDVEQRREAIRHVLSAVGYGLRNGFLALTAAQGEEPAPTLPCGHKGPLTQCGNDVTGHWIGCPVCGARCPNVEEPASNSRQGTVSGQADAVIQGSAGRYRPPEGWLQEVVRDAQQEVESWPEWKRNASTLTAPDHTAAIREAVGALEPFAAYADKIEPDTVNYLPDPCPLRGLPEDSHASGVSPTAGDCRRAREALAKLSDIIGEQSHEAR